MDIQDLLSKTVQNNASDLHLVVGEHPVLRIDGRLTNLNTYPEVTSSEMERMIGTILSQNQRELLTSNRNLDFSYAFGGGNYGDIGRFRVNCFYQRGTLAAAFRLLPAKIRTIEELGLPNICHNFATLKQGFILVTGPTGHGKSTTIAAILNEINLTRATNILTIEDPIEYVYPKGKSIITQRELGSDTHSWHEGLKNALREDIDVVLIGEMRDPESIAAAISIAETGHLVFSTLHTNSASQSIDRIIDSFPENQQAQIKTQLAATLGGIISQRLLERLDSGRVVATEVLLTTNGVRANIRDGKTHLIDSILETSQNEGMIPLEVSLANLVKEGIVSLENAKSYALHPDAFLRLL
ncbi:MAG: PilT/PilU family type 4a pilus ATPase [Candidatus Levybacteria bacterium]|nr:PilT/PilU family type 4a pilus ATPase [Candidatus Levybacteria bacterium]